MTPKEILFSSIEVANIHEGRLKNALDYLGKLFPMDEKKFSELSKEDYAFLDVMAIRYAKLQDLIGSKIFYLFLEVIAEPVDNSRFLDVLARLEKVGVLPSMNFWLDLRTIRNTIAHEYPNQPNLLIQHMNRLYDASQKLLTFWCQFLKEVDRISKAN